MLRESVKDKRTTLLMTGLDPGVNIFQVDYWYFLLFFFKKRKNYFLDDEFQISEYHIGFLLDSSCI